MKRLTILYPDKSNKIENYMYWVNQFPNKIVKQNEISGLNDEIVLFQDFMNKNPNLFNNKFSQTLEKFYKDEQMNKDYPLLFRLC